MENPVEAIESTRPTRISIEDVPPLDRRLGRKSQFYSRALAVAVLLLSDILLVALVWGALAFSYGVWSGSVGIGKVGFVDLLPGLALWVGLRALLELYPGYGLDEAGELQRQTYGSLLAMAVAGITAYIFDLGGLLLVLAGCAGLVVLAPFQRSLVKLAIRQVGLWGKPVIVLGSQGTGLSLSKVLHKEWQLGFRPVIVSDSHATLAEEAFDVANPAKPLVTSEPLVNTLSQAQDHGVDTVMIAMPYARREDLAKLVRVVSNSFQYAVVMPDLGGISNSAVTARYLAGSLGVEIRHTLLDPWARRAKRTLDSIATVAGGLLISPLLLAVVVLIKLDSPGPAFYSQRRLGAGGHHFRCWKFRTMYTDAEQLLDEFLKGKPDLQAEWEQNFKLRNDPRVTRVGRFLRKTSLDELPQLWNVLRGEMSLVGPRPIVDAEIPKYGTIYNMYRRIRPGMSGFWQVSGRSDTDYTERVKLDAYYVHNWSIWLDLIILVRTVWCVLLGRGAC